jgi:hypothetical protein
VDKMSNNELVSKIVMWRKELENQGANMGIMAVFDSMCVYIGEQQRKTDNSKWIDSNGKIKGLDPNLANFKPKHLGS